MSISNTKTPSILKKWLYSATAILSAAAAPSFAFGQTPSTNPFAQDFSFTFDQTLTGGYSQPFDVTIPLTMPQAFSYVIPQGYTATSSDVASLYNVNINTNTTTTENPANCNVFFPCPSATVNQTGALTASSAALGLSASTNNATQTYNLVSLPPTLTRAAQYSGLTSNPSVVALNPQGGSASAGSYPIDFSLQVQSPSTVNRKYTEVSGTITGTLGLASNAGGQPLPAPTPTTPPPTTNQSGLPSQPGAPQVPVYQPNQQLKFVENYNAQLLTAASIPLAILSPLTAPLTLTVLGGEAAVLRAQALADPIDNNYTLVATPQDITLPNAGAYTTLDNDVARMLALGDAALTSINRYSGAAAAGDAASAQAQLDAYNNYTSQEVIIYIRKQLPHDVDRAGCARLSNTTYRACFLIYLIASQELALVKTAGMDLEALSSSGLASTTLTPEQVAALEQEIESGALKPSDELAQLGIKLTGLSSSDLDSLFAQLVSTTDPTSVAGLYPAKFGDFGVQLISGPGNAVPEPTSLAIFAIGLLGVIAARRRVV